MYRILIAGAGYAGLRIASYFVREKQKVFGLIKDPARREALERKAVLPVLADLTRPGTLGDLPAVHFVVIAVAPDGRTEADYRAVYLEGIRHLLDALRVHTPPRLIVHLSSTGVYGEKHGDWVDEETSPEPENEKGRILLRAEEQVLGSGFQTVVLRLAGIYGPGRNRVAEVRAGGLPRGEKEKYMNMIHVDDIAPAVYALFRNAEPGKVYLGCDDEPVASPVFFEWLCARLGAASASKKKGEGPVLGKRCRNGRLKSLGVQWTYPTFREGYDSILKEEGIRV
ncbi:MAG: SDR family oxidoreductase [Candidatus Omnitrophota bacterium]